MSFLNILIFGAAAASAPTITVASKSDGYIATTKPFAVTDEAAVEAEVSRQATELCAGKSVKWGTFGSEAKIDRQSEKAPEVANYFKEFSCAEVEQRDYAAAPADWKSSSADDADVRAFFDRYYSKRDGGDFSAAAAKFDPTQGMTLGSQVQREFNGKLGSGSRQVTKVTWYVNPDGADHPGVFVALDFVGRYKSMHFYCGYLMLYRIGQGSYDIVREEQNQYERNEHAPAPGELATMRSAFCRDG